MDEKTIAQKTFACIYTKGQVAFRKTSWICQSARIGSKAT